MTQQIKIKQDSQGAKTSDSAALEDSIKVYLPKNDTWKVELFIPFAEMSHDKLTSILRLAKVKISKRDKIPIGLLSYHDLMDKETLSEGYQITAKIVRTEVETGDPGLKLVNIVRDNIEYPNMALYLDIFPKKNNGEEIKLKDITELLQKENIALEKVNLKAIDDAVMMVMQDLVTVRNLLIAEGQFPESSEDARLDFQLRFREESRGNYIATEKVDAEQIILRLIPMRKGEKEGLTLRGKILKPRIPADIELFTGEGVRINAQAEVFAETAGLPRIKEISIKEGIRKIKISVEALEVVDGSTKVDITTENHLQVNGGVKSGSNIIARGEVLVEGDVEENTMISASGDVNVTGVVKGGSITSERNIDSQGDVHGCRLIANGILTINGTAHNSHLVGYEVHSQHVKGCEIKVGHKVVIDTVSADEKGFSARITVGLVEHLKEKIEDNKKFINYADKNLRRFKAIVGEEILQEATPANISRMTIIYCRDAKNKGILSLSKPQMDALKKLFAAIGPIRDTMLEKKRAINLYLTQMKNGDQNNPQIYVKNRIEQAVEIDIKGVKGKLEPQEGPILIREGGGEFVVDRVKEGEGEV